MKSDFSSTNKPIKDIMKIIIRVSLLLLMVILGFTVIMPGWHDNLGIITSEITNRFKTSEELVAIEKKQRKQREYEFRAKAENSTVEAIEEQEKEAKLKSAKRIQLKLFTKTNKAQELTNLIKSFEAKDIPTELYQIAIKSNSKLSFQALLDAKVACDYSSSSGRYAFNTAINSDDTYYFKTLIFELCSTVNNTNQRRLSELLLVREQFDLMRLVPITNNNIRDFDRATNYLVEKKNIRYAIAFLRLGISKNKLRGILSKAIRYDLTEVALTTIELGANFSVESKKDLSSSPLLNALARNNITVAIEILSRDPEYISRESLKHDDLFLASLSAKNSLAMIELLFSNGLDVKRFKNNGIHAVESAIVSSKPKELAILLNNGIDPKQLIGSHTFLEYAQRRYGKSTDENTIKNQDEIIAVLKKAGVPSNGLNVAKSEIAKYGEAKCEFEPIEHDFSSGIDAIKQHINSGKKLSKTAHCELLVLSCTATTLKLDDCLNAVPECGTRSGSGTYCCSSEIKSTYLEARCAGFSPHGSVYRIKGLNTVYTIPTILINER